jgi:hydrogenase maturation protease
MTIVIGYGNELRGDDGIGPALIRQLDSLGLKDVTTLAVQQLTPELAALLAEHRHAVFVDASVNGETAVRMERLAASTTPGYSAHIADPKDLLVLTDQVYQRLPQAWQVTIRGSDFEIGHGPTQLGLENMRRALELIQDLVKIYDPNG